MLPIPKITEYPQLKVLQVPNESLRTIASKVELEEIETAHSLAREMLRIMRADNGIGLAAPQLGIPLRIIVFQVYGHESMIMINPEIIHRDALQWSQEGCLSIPFTKSRIRRSKRIKVKYLNEFGKEMQAKLSNHPAAVVQHEIDHLNGVLFTDHIKG